MAAYPLLVRYNVTTPPTFSHTLDQPLYIYFSFITSILGFLQTSLLCPISFFFFYEKKVKCVPLFKLISQLLVSHTQVGLQLRTTDGALAGSTVARSGGRGESPS